MITETTTTYRDYLDTFAEAMDFVRAHVPYVAGVPFSVSIVANDNLSRMMPDDVGQRFRVMVSVTVERSGEK